MERELHELLAREVEDHPELRGVALEVVPDLPHDGLYCWGERLVQVKGEICVNEEYATLVTLHELGHAMQDAYGAFTKKQLRQDYQSGGVIYCRIELDAWDRAVGEFARLFPGRQISPTSRHLEVVRGLLARLDFMENRCESRRSRNRRKRSANFSHVP